MSTENKVQVGAGMVLDRKRAVLCLNAETIQLTPLEAKVMTLLMENVDRVVSRETISQAVWNGADQVSDRTLDVHIHALRQKVEANPRIPELILTRRGLGYELRTSALTGITIS